MKSRTIVVCTFESEHNLVSATRAAREKGYPIIDAYTPFAVHGLDKAMGLKPSRLPIVSFLFGLIGVLAIVYFQYWASARDWPINVGGKPWNSWPAFVPITFEIMVLFAGLGTVVVFFLRCGLYAGKQARLTDPGVTHDRFVLVVGADWAGYDSSEAKELFDHFHTLSMQERTVEP